MRKDELVCGIHPVMEALRSDLHIEKLLIRRDAGGTGIRDLKYLARETGVPWQPVPGEKLDRLTTTEHQGVIAFISATMSSASITFVWRFRSSPWSRSVGGRPTVR